MQYGQNISIPYTHSQPQTDHNNMFNNDHKNNVIKTKMERDREDGKCFSFECRACAEIYPNQKNIL